MHRKILSVILVIAIACTAFALSACNEEGKTIIQYGSKTATGTINAVSEKQNFYTKCLNCFDVVWDDEDGLYIYTDSKGSIPYVLLYRYNDVSVDEKQYLEEGIVPSMQKDYGDDLLETSEVKQFDVGEQKVWGAQFKYRVGEFTVTALMLCKKYGSDLMRFTAKTIEEDDRATLDTLDMAVKNLVLDKKPEAEVQTSKVAAANGVNIKPSEVKQVSYVKYSDPSGYFTMEIPNGWKVQTGLKPTGEIDLISYAITVYDPNNVDRMLYFNLNCVAGLKSQDAKDWYAKYYGSDNTYAQMLVVSDITTEGLFKAASQYYGYKDFKTIQNINKSVLGGDVLTANCTSLATGKNLEGLFTATLSPMTYNVQRDMFNYAAGMLDVGLITAYSIIMETTPVEDFIDWQPVLDHCLGSIAFTDTFMTERQKVWKQIMGTSSYIMNSANEVSDMIMDSWEKRNKSYDVISQKQSDATLGYQRVYDTETNEYYKAQNGFGDWYDGSRYKVVDDDNAYLSPISGYIEWH